MSKIITPIDITTATYEELKEHKAVIEEIANYHKGTAKELELKKEIADIDYEIGRRVEECM